MLDSIDVLGAQGDLLTLTLENPNAGLIVERIDGLGPVKATLVSSGFAQLDGEYYQASRREKRTISMRLKLDPDYGADISVYDLRRELYKYFMTKHETKLTFHNSEDTGMVPVEIVGRVESMEPDFFAKEPTVDISIVCFDPDFKAVDGTSFVAPFPDTPAEITHVYPGSIETGFWISILVEYISELVIEIEDPNENVKSMVFSVPSPFDSGDTVVVDTKQGAKKVTWQSGTTVSSLLYALSPESTWLELLPGENIMRVLGDGLPLRYQIIYNARYGGL